MLKCEIPAFCQIAPEGETVAESMKYFEEMVDYIGKLQKGHGKKLLWNTANNFGDKKFMAGAATSPSADVIKSISVKLHNFLLIFPHRDKMKRFISS